MDVLGQGVASAMPTSASRSTGPHVVRGTVLSVYVKIRKPKLDWPIYGLGVDTVYR